eukprot:COSAG03_NODE_2825_length_2429_cov_2.882403_3_plen_44_part_00
MQPSMMFALTTRFSALGYNQCAPHTVFAVGTVPTLECTLHGHG